MFSNKCRSDLKDYEVPKYYHFLEEMPYTPNNKYDFVLLEKMAKELVKKTAP